MSGRDHDVCPPARTRWRVAAVVLTTVLAAAACAADRAGTRPPTTSIRTTGVPAATSHGGSAAPPARNLRGLIAYSTLRADGTETIVTTDPDGTHVYDTGVVGGECAEWSPDGSRLAYCHHPGNGDFDVWVMNADGSHQRRLTAHVAGTTRAPGRPTASGSPSARSAWGASTCS
jgi:hypothetical protein